jgi:acetyl/propionyl-CoA carboxylase alpha subunit/acetyl-CoA carboxylase carboxyltransferase component
MPGSDFRRIAVVNRGEPAVRFLHAAREFDRQHGIPLCVLALHTAAERHARFVRESDEAVCLDDFIDGDAPEKSPYLDHGVLERALRHCRAEAVWPGWGFVAEDDDFAALCERLGITFLGPTAAVMRRLGDKIEAKRLAEEAGVPVAAWSNGPVETVEDALRHGATIGYPLVVKATAGGGGRGIRHVTGEGDLTDAFESARSEAAKSFGDPTVFIEKRVTDARHVEVQVIADQHGTVWAVGVRDCSIQRRNQKVIEESHSTALDADQEAGLRAAAERLCERVGYSGAGTVEFLYQPAERTFAFLEVNTRLQVEHTVTELTTGLDLVKLQIHVARGGHLEGEPPVSSGHAIEARLNAEDPDRGFAPAPGTVELCVIPTGPGVRVDSGVAEGDAISPLYDSMVAKVMAWGRDRDEARARLQQALVDMAVVVRDGVTNKSFLLDLLAAPEVVSGTFDTGWLDRVTADGARLAIEDPATARIALIAAGIDADEFQAGLERAQFLASASRGRPEASRAVGRVVEFRFGGQAYALRVARAGRHGWYRVEIDGHVVDVVCERLASYRSRLTMGGRSHRLVSSRAGNDHIVEVDGRAYRLSGDDGGVIRAPAAAVVAQVLVAQDEVVEAGARLLVVEAMKMEVAITAPVAGRVRSVMVSSNTQVQAGAPLLRLEPVEEEGEGAAAAAGDRLTFDDVVTPKVDDPRARALEALETLRSFLAGFDLTATEARNVFDAYLHDPIRRDAQRPELFRGELAALATFADLSELSRTRREGDTIDADRSSREHFRVYLRSLDVEREGLPEWFRAALQRALSHYGIADLENTPQLHDALHCIVIAHERAPSHVPVVLGLLEGLAAEADCLVDPLRHELRQLLDRLIVATQRRFPVVGNLARSIRYRCFDQPLIQKARTDALTEARVHLDHLAGHLNGDDREARLAALVATPQPLLPLVADRIGDPVGSEPMIEVLTRRYYKIRELEDLRPVVVEGQHLVTARYFHRGRRVHVVAGGGERARLHDVVRATVAAAQGALPAEAADPDGAPDTVVVDLYIADQDPPASDDDLVAAFGPVLESAGYPAAVGRISVAVCQVGDPLAQPQQLTFHRQREGYVERPLVRGLHPMIARRLRLWRLETFDLTRLPSAPDVYLFDCVAPENPSDERLIAIAEVRDLTEVRDEDGTVTELPELEQVLASCLDSLRMAQAAHPRGDQLAWNRVQLDVSPLVEAPLEELLAVARRVAPSTEGLGLDQILVQCRVAEPGAIPPLREVVIRMGRLAGSGLAVRVDDPPTAPMQPMDEYTRKVIQSQRRGVPYPYELVTMLAGPGGVFVEHDLDADGALVPVDRPAGGNQAGLVVGVVTTPTSRYPEGMTRVAVLGDPTKALGSIAEAECRLLLGALDLARKLGVPIEWFALSAGAKIAMDSGSENLDWVGRVLRRLVEHTQAGGEVNVVVTGINVGAQPYWNAEATMLMHTKGILVMTPESAMVLTGKQALDYAGGVSAEDNLGLGGYERIMGPNGEAQYWAPDVAAACEILFAHYEHTYLAPGERFPRQADTDDPDDRDVRQVPHETPGIDFTTIGDIFSSEHNLERKKPFDIRTMMRAVADRDHPPLERWPAMGEAETAVVFDAHLGGHPVALLGVESRPLPRRGAVAADGPDSWSAGTLFPLSSKKMARALNTASGNRPVVILANLSGFDGSPESLRRLQLEYGAEIGRAVVNFDGPIVLCVISRYHGGAFVVFSATLSDTMEVLAVEGSFASVIGGSAAAAVVFGHQVKARVKADPRIVDLEDRIAKADEDERAELRTRLVELTDTVRLEKLGEVGDEFDAIHSVERALAVGSVHRIIPAAELRPALIDAVRRGMDKTLARRAGASP